MRPSPLWILAWVLFPSLAAARSPVLLARQPAPALEARITPGLHAGTLELVLANPRDVAFVTTPELVIVELSNAHATRKLHITRERIVVAPRGVHREQLALDPHTRDLPRGTYDVVVTWQSPELHAVARASTVAPYHCAFAAARPAPPSPSSPSRSLVLVIGAWLVAAGLARRAGTTVAHVP